MLYTRTTNQAAALQQRFVISDCLFKMGYKQLAHVAQSGDNSYQDQTLLLDLINIIKQEAASRKDFKTLSKLSHYELIG